MGQNKMSMNINEKGCNFYNNQNFLQYIYNEFYQNNNNKLLISCYNKKIKMKMHNKMYQNTHHIKRQETIINLPLLSRISKFNVNMTINLKNHLRKISSFTK